MIRQKKPRGHGADHAVNLTSLADPFTAGSRADGVAEAAVFPATPAAVPNHGAVVRVDGGRLAR